MESAPNTAQAAAKQAPLCQMAVGGEGLEDETHLMGQISRTHFDPGGCIYQHFLHTKTMAIPERTGPTGFQRKMLGSLGISSPALCPIQPPLPYLQSLCPWEFCTTSLIQPTPPHPEKALHHQTAHISRACHSRNLQTPPSCSSLGSKEAFPGDSPPATQRLPTL